MKCTGRLVINLLLSFSILTPSALSAIPSKSEITLYADDAYPPYSFVEDGELRGIYVDMLRAAAASFSQQYQLNIIPVPWKRALREAQKGEITGLIPPFKYQGKRPYIWPYSEPLMDELIVAFCNKSVQAEAFFQKTTQSAHRQLNVGINAGYKVFSTPLENAHQQGVFNVWENKDTEHNLRKLLTDKIDCYINDKISTLWEINNLLAKGIINNQDVAKIQQLIEVKSGTSYIGYSRNNSLPHKDDFIQRMDQALRELKASEKMKHIVQKYTNSLNQQQ